VTNYKFGVIRIVNNYFPQEELKLEEEEVLKMIIREKMDIR